MRLSNGLIRNLERKEIKMIQIEELERRITALENRLTPAETHSEPKPLLSDAQVGWICKRRDGKYFQD